MQFVKLCRYLLARLAVILNAKRVMSDDER
ncbi:hypothetical protein SAMN05216386_1266 [Nitrosospira briensis]|uniref:Uncharacterized protein n=1 Tax=Nitrosospira briensis TaxID=35799 RepID=A0A1I5A8N8_9PROT|nr:hypothetical protein SAMN05216386_1266 [Nitrosospira briensis]SFN93194.1 hypothetical protein SAMN05216332_102391 [Nitrosospira briensis]